MSKPRIFLIVSFLGVFLFGIYEKTEAIGFNRLTDDQPEEVGLVFRYKGGINNVVVTAYYWNNQFYLPVNSLFSILGINHKFDTQSKKVFGYYLKKNNPYVINFSSRTITFNHHTYPLNKDDFIIGKLDYYLLPKVFAKVFNLKFSVDFSQLSMSLKTPDTMPVVTLYEQQQKRANIATHSLYRPDYNIIYPRKRHILDGGFLDYNGNVNISQTGNVYGYDLDGGAEVLGGDIQGYVNGSYSNGSTYLDANNIRWRYGIRSNPYLSQVSLGQLSTDGLFNASYTGIKVTNQPINFRYSYVNYAYRGKADPGSDVELYINGQLIDFKKADNLGNFSFRIPLIYGNSLVSIRIFGPYGTVRTIEKRFQIPYTYLKPGEFNYFIDAGKLQSALVNESNKDYMAQSGVIYGFNNWLTDKFGVDYVNSSQYNRPVVYNSLSARIAKQYLMSVDLAPNNFYRFNAGVSYPSLANWQIGFGHYVGNTLYNSGSSSNNYSVNMYVPIHLGNFPFSWQIGSNGSMLKNYTSINYNTSIIMQILGASFQLGYNDRSLFVKNSANVNESNLNATLTYTFYSRARLLRGLTLRSELINQMNPWKVGTFDLQAIKTVHNNFQFNFDFGRNFQVGYSYLSVGLQINLDKVQSTTTYQNSGGQAYVGESVRGSIGYDSENKDFAFTNRHEVGASAATVRYYVDSNNNGKYDQGEKVLKDNVMRLWRSTSSYQDKNGIVHYFDLQPYNKYNATIDTNLISNPVLFPGVSKFAFVTGANYFKTVNIPFYPTGVISGMVSQKADTTQQPIAGMQVHIHSVAGNYNKTLQTFNDGSFYSMGVPVGKYIAEVDSSQLSFLDAKSIPDTIHFRVKALPNGDFIDSLNFVLESRKSVPDTTAKPDTSTVIKQQAGILNKPENTRSSRENDEGVTKYYVEINHYAKFDDCAKHFRAISEKTRSKFFIAFNEVQNKYGIFTDGIREKDKADLQKEQYLKRGFKNTSVIAKKKPYLRKLDFAIQLGTFSKKKSAIQFSKEAGYVLARKNTIHFDTQLKTYQVVLEPFANVDSVYALKNKICRTVKYRNAFIIPNPDDERTDMYFHTYFVQIGAFSNRNVAKSFAKIAAHKIHVETDVSLLKRKHIYRVITLPLKQFSDAMELKKQIASMSDYKGAFIITDSTRASTFDHVNYTIQLGAFRNHKSSVRLAGNAQKQYGLNVRSFLKPSTNLYTVQLGPITGWKQARSIQNGFLKSKPYDDAMLLLANHNDMGLLNEQESPGLGDLQ